MLATLGHEVSALGVARLYAGLIDGFVIDEVDRELVPAIELLGPRVLVTATVMGGEAIGGGWRPKCSISPLRWLGSGRRRGERADRRRRPDPVVARRQDAFVAGAR